MLEVEECGYVRFKEIYSMESRVLKHPYFLDLYFQFTLPLTGGPGIKKMIYCVGLPQRRFGQFLLT